MAMHCTRQTFWQQRQCISADQACTAHQSRFIGAFISELHPAWQQRGSASNNGTASATCVAHSASVANIPAAAYSRMLPASAHAGRGASLPSSFAKVTRREPSRLARSRLKHEGSTGRPIQTKCLSPSIGDVRRGMLYELSSPARVALGTHGCVAAVSLCSIMFLLQGAEVRTPTLLCRIHLASGLPSLIALSWA